MTKNAILCTGIRNKKKRVTSPTSIFFLQFAEEISMTGGGNE